GLAVTRVFLPPRRIGTAQYGRVQLEQVLEVTHGEGIDPARGQEIDQLVAGDHVVDHVVGERVAGRAQLPVGPRELPLDAPQGRLDGREIEPSTGRVARRLVARVRRGYWMCSSAARECRATSAGRAM